MDHSEYLGNVLAELSQLRRYKNQTDTLLKQLFEAYPEAQSTFQKWATRLDEKPEIKDFISKDECKTEQS